MNLKFLFLALCLFGLTTSYLETQRKEPVAYRMGEGLNSFIVWKLR